MQEPDRTMFVIWVVAVLYTSAAAAGTHMPLNDTGNIVKNIGLQRADIQYRLEEHTVPVHYKIKITPEFQEGKPEKFTGHVEIDALVIKATGKITLHKADNIKIDYDTIKVTEKNSDVSLVKPGSPSKDNEAEFYEILLTDIVAENKEIIIIIDYNADFPDGMYGFYKSTYPVTSGNKETTEDVLLVTQFQPTHARKAFPCFDEPGLKATFEVTLVIPEDYDALSNTGKKNTVNIEATKSVEITFDTTPKMSTYLLAFIVFKSVTYGKTGTVSGRLPFQTWGRVTEINAGKGKLSQTDGPKIIEKLEQFTGILYTTHAKKIDQAAIPDLSFGAMENWGLVTYRETALLYDEKEHTQVAKKRVSELIAHELTHQWFGNLVTTEWWDSAWLNEGFATYFQYYVTNQLHPQWRMMERVVVDEQLAAFAADASPSSSALTNTVNSPEEVADHFGTITYSKGGSILFMFSQILGEDKFKAALQSYLKENALKTGTPTKLFDALKKNAGDIGLPSNVDLGYVFESWTVRNGFPVINVTREESRIWFNQEKFHADGTTGKNQYNVHITLTSNDEDYDGRKVWILDTDKSVFVTGVPNPDSWLLIPTTGYFRVNYDEENWSVLTEHLRNGSLDESLIEPVERAILIDNALNLARANRLQYSTAIQLLSYLEYELDYIPWSVAFSGLNYIHHMLLDEGDVIDRFILHIIENVYEELGFEIVDTTDDETHIQHVHRANVLNWACRVGHQECISSAVEHLQNYLEKEESVKVAPDLRSAVYCCGVKHKDSLWTKLWKKLQLTEDATERSLLISSLGCSKVYGTLYLYLETTVLSGSVRTQDIVSVFSSVYSNAEGVDVALHFLDYNLPKIEERTVTVMNGLPNILRGVAKYIHKQDQLDKLVNIEGRLTNPEHKKIAQSGIDTANANIKWLQAHKETVLSEMNEIAPPVVATPAPSSTPGGAWAVRPAGLAVAIAVTLPALALLL